MKILLTGISGQIGHDLAKTLGGLAEIVAVSREQMNLEDINQIRHVIRTVKPSLIINPAAYTAVAAAEVNIEQATRINAIAPGIIAQEAQHIGASMIHFSTDYVFDGNTTAPYSEDDTCNPVNVYGTSKLAGEVAVRSHCEHHWILRTSWVYSVHGNNFLKTVIRLAQEKEQLSMVYDQIGAPTWSRTISTITRHMLTGQNQQINADILRQTTGTYHLTSRGETSWYDYAQFIVARLQASGIPLALNPASIKPVSGKTFPIPPARPENSRLSCAKLLATFGIDTPAWQDDVATCMTEILGAYPLDSGSTGHL